MLVARPSVCQRNYNRSGLCREHYERLAKASGRVAAPVQCPYGFASYSVFRDPVRVAFTGVIPYPRVGGELERAHAKRFPENRVAVSALEKGGTALLAAADRLGQLETEAVKGHSMALHEIRKLNRSVKQTAERLCLKEHPEDPQASNPDLVRIWKTSELMSQQFDIIEILANESLASLPLNSRFNLYKLVDKCVRIYRPGSDRRIALTAPHPYSPEIQACDKTVAIIPTVLIENALRYSLPGTEVTVSLRPAEGQCLLEVSDLTAANPDLTPKVFGRGVRASPDTEGSGTGLYVAQLVARQHGSEITMRLDQASAGVVKCTFAMPFKVL
jgi:signal transduction histidine kinase